MKKHTPQDNFPAGYAESTYEKWAQRYHVCLSDHTGTAWRCQPLFCGFYNMFTLILLHYYFIIIAYINSFVKLL